MPTIRVIPVLLLRGNGIVKTVRFRTETYIGCPINAVRVFNRKDVDELVILDVRATPEGREPDLPLLQPILDEALMPVCLGGGIRTSAQIRELLKCGADKVALNTVACEQPEFVREAAEKFGSQAIVASIDVKRRWTGKHEVYSRHGRRRTRLDPVAHAVRMQELGAGEILLNSIDRDGTWSGYDLDLLRRVADAVSIPVIACGGAGSLADFAAGVTEGHASAVAAGSLFLFHGRRRGILISFPESDDLLRAFGEDRVRADRLPRGTS